MAVVAGDDIARSGCGPADRGVIGIVDVHADRRIAEVARAECVQADVVAPDHIGLGQIAGGGVDELNAVAVVAANDIAFGRRCAADDVVCRADNLNAVGRIAPVDGSRDIRADVIAVDDIAAVRLQQDAVAAETIDDQAAHRAVAGGDDQPADARTGAAAIEFDHGRRSEVRFAGAVDDHRVGDRGQLRKHGDGVRPGSRNVEAHVVDPRAGVGVQDRLPQRAGAAIVGVGHTETQRQDHVVAVAASVRDDGGQAAAEEVGNDAAFDQSAERSDDRVRPVVVENPELLADRRHEAAERSGRQIHTAADGDGTDDVELIVVGRAVARCDAADLQHQRRIRCELDAAGIQYAGAGAGSHD